MDAALGHIATQLELVERRQAALGELESELREREALARRRRAELGTTQLLAITAALVVTETETMSVTATSIASTAA